MKLQNMKKVLIALGIIMYISSAHSQVKLPTLAQLGSSSRVVGNFNPDLNAVTRLALPSYDDKSLSAMIEMVAKKYANGSDPLTVNLKAIETLYNIKAQEDGNVQEREFSYQISKKDGRIYLHREHPSFIPYPVARGEVELKAAAKVHLVTLESFGIKKPQLSFLNSNLVLLENVEKLPNGGFGKPSSPLVDDIFTYGQRSIEGIMVDGSYVKVLSKDARINEGLIINWPRFMLHPELRNFEVKSKAEVLAQALEHLKLVANPKNESNIKMAVVFRPVMMGESRIFIPAMKVGLYSRPTGGRLPNDKGENGELFYIDLMKQQLNYSEGKLEDTTSSGDQT